MSIVTPSLLFDLELVTTEGKMHILAYLLIVTYIWVVYRLPIIVFVLIILIFSVMFFFTKRVRITELIIIFLVGVFFLFHLSQYLFSRPLVIGELDDGLIVAEIIDVLNHDTDYLRVTAKLENNEKILVSYRGEIKESLYPGLVFQASTSHQAIQTATNEGQFDYQLYLLEQNIHYHVSASNFHLIAAKRNHILHRFRYRSIERLEAQLKPEVAGWVISLVLGDRSSLTDEVKTVFTRWHLSHLLAISGLHIGLIILGLSLVLSRGFNITKETIAKIMVMLLLFFPFLAGGTPSVWRASLLGAFGYLAFSFKTKVKMIDLLSLIFIILVIVNPFWINQLGFQFSFLVTYSLLLSRPILKTYKKLYQQLLFISLLSFFITLPLQLLHFHLINPLSLIINPLMSLFFSFIFIPLTYLLFITSFLFPYLVIPLQSLLSVISAGLNFFLQTIDQLFYYPVVIGSPKALDIFLYYVVFIFLMMKIELRNWRIASRYFCLLIAIIFLMYFRPFLYPYGKITTFDLGQANAQMIELPYRKGIIFYDLGGTLEKDFQTPSNQLYETRLKPLLFKKGIRKIDAVILSHNHHDHVGSLPFLEVDFQVKTVVQSLYFETDEQSDPNRNIFRVGADEVLNIGGQNFYVLSPSANYGDENDESLVLLAEFGGLNWLFTGDISATVESRIMNRYPDLSVDVLMIPHHGSNTSTSELLIEKTKPGYGIISVGEENRFNHPHPDVIDRLDAYHVERFRTDQDGAITFTFDGKNNRYFFERYRD